MKKYGVIVLIWLCLAGIPVISYGALDWQIRWNESESLQIARVFIFNPESTNQPFSLEIGDIAEIADADPTAPQLIIGQDRSLRLAPGERKIFDILVYQDIDPRHVYAPSQGGKTYQLSSDSYQVLQQYYDSPSSSRDYPVSIRAISPVPKPGAEPNRYTYRSGRGYWTSALVDHDHVIEQLIRTGDRIGALHNSIQQAVLFYTQGDMVLTDEALKVWQTAFPELQATPSATPVPNNGSCGLFVMAVSSNRTQYPVTRTIMIGDVLGASTKTLSTVVAAEDLRYSIPANTKNSKRLLRVFVMKKQGRPASESEYVNVINHHKELEQVIRIGQAGNDHPCAIQDVIWYVNKEVPSLTLGKALWNRLHGKATPTPPRRGGQPTCLGGPYGRPLSLQGNATSWKNLIVLVGTVVPFSLVFRRKGRK